MILGWVYGAPVDVPAPPRTAQRAQPPGVQVWGLGATTAAMLTGRPWRECWDYAAVQGYEGQTEKSASPRPGRHVANGTGRLPLRRYVQDEEAKRPTRPRFPARLAAESPAVQFVRRCTRLFPHERATAQQLLEVHAPETHVPNSRNKEGVPTHRGSMDHRIPAAGPVLSGRAG